MRAVRDKIPGSSCFVKANHTSNKLKRGKCGGQQRRRRNTRRVWLCFSLDDLAWALVVLAGSEKGCTGSIFVSHALQVKCSNVKIVMATRVEERSEQG